jgi:hypothetical protein
MFEIVNVAVPGFDTVNVCEVGAPTFTFPNAMLLGETEIPGWLVVPPVALNPTTTSGVVELLAIETLPAKLPELGGTMLALKVALCPGRIVIGNDTPEIENPRPAAATFEIVNVEEPGFVIVTVWVIVWPTATVPNETSAGATEITGWLAARPAPLIPPTMLGVVELLVIVKLPVRFPDVGGIIETLTGML